MLPVLLCLLGPVDISEEQQEADKDQAQARPTPDKIFSLKFIRTLLSEKYFKTKEGSDEGREMETIRHEDVSESLLENKKDEENQVESHSWQFKIIFCKTQVSYKKHLNIMI